MKKRILISILTTALILQLTKAYDPVNIIKLSDRNIRIAIKKYPRVLIFFHNNWCKHSKQALKNLITLSKSKMSSRLREQKIVLTQYNTKQENDILNELRVRQTPSIKLFIGGVEIMYNKPNFEPKNIIEFIEEKSVKEISEFQKISELKKAVKSNPVVVFYGNERSHRYPLFRSASYMFENIKFGLLKPKRNNKNVKSLKEDNINILMTNGKILHYKKAWTQDRINNWIFKNLNPGIVDLNRDYARLIVDKKNPAFLFIVIYFLIFFFRIVVKMSEKD